MVANTAFNALKKDSTRHSTEVSRKRGNVRDRSATDSVMDTTTRTSLFKVRRDFSASPLPSLRRVLSARCSTRACWTRSTAL